MEGKWRKTEGYRGGKRRLKNCWAFRMYDPNEVPELGTFAELLDWFLSAKKSPE